MRTLANGAFKGAFPFLFSVSALATPVIPPPPDPLPDLIERIGPGVVNISSTAIVANAPRGMEDFFKLWGIPEARKSTSRGSGFLIDKEGYVITNFHVVDEATEVMVNFADKREYKARIVGRDPKLDIALLQIRDGDRKVPAALIPCELGDSNQVRIGQSVVAIGNPFGLQNTVTRGIISAKNRSIGIGPLDNFLQTDASINPGNSGGPLFNLSGEVIGINSAIYSPSGQSSGLGFSIPVNEAKKVIPDLKKYGRVPRPWLGILSERINLALAGHYQLPLSEGLLIYNLVEGGPADRSGIQQGDIVVSAAGHDIKETMELERELNRLKPTDTLKVVIQRGRKKLTLDVKLMELPPRFEKLPQGII